MSFKKSVWNFVRLKLQYNLNFCSKLALTEYNLNFLSTFEGSTDGFKASHTELLFLNLVYSNYIYIVEQEDIMSLTKEERPSLGSISEPFNATMEQQALLAKVRM